MLMPLHPTSKWSVQIALATQEWYSLLWLLLRIKFYVLLGDYAPPLSADALGGWGVARKTLIIFATYKWRPVY